MDKPVFFPDHIGWAAARFSRAWNTQFHAEMRAAGYDWAGEARAAILAHLPPGGLAQAELTRRIGLTKQAVQQHVDGLVADGILQREAHHGDARSKWVGYTELGRQALSDGNKIKAKIEANLSHEFSADTVSELRRLLHIMSEHLVK